MAASQLIKLAVIHAAVEAPQHKGSCVAQRGCRITSAAKLLAPLYSCVTLVPITPLFDGVDGALRRHVENGL